MQYLKMIELKHGEIITQIYEYPNMVIQRWKAEGGSGKWHYYTYPDDVTYKQVLKSKFKFYDFDEITEYIVL